MTVPTEQTTQLPPLIYDQLLEQWSEIKDQLMVEQRIDPSDPLVTAPSDDLAEDE